MHCLGLKNTQQKLSHTCPWQLFIHHLVNEWEAVTWFFIFKTFRGIYLKKDKTDCVVFPQSLLTSHFSEKSRTAFDTSHWFCPKRPRDSAKVAALQSLLANVVALKVGLPYRVWLHLHRFSCALLFHVLIKRNNSFGKESIIQFPEITLPFLNCQIYFIFTRHVTRENKVAKWCRLLLCSHEVSIALDFVAVVTHFCKFTKKCHKTNCF